MNRVAHVKHSRIIGIVLLLTVCISCREKEEPQQKPASGNCDLVSFVLEKGRNSLSHDIEFTFDTENRTLKGMYLDWIDGDSPDRLIPRFKITGKEVRVNGKKIESDRLWEDPDFRMKVRARWESKRAALLDTIDRELDLQPVRMHKAIEANYTVWPFYYQASTEAKMPEKTYEAEIARIRRLTYARANLLDQLFAR